MTRRERRMVVLGRLKAKPLLVWQVLCALLLAGLLVRQAGVAWNDGADEVMRSILFGNPVVTALIVMAAVGLVHFHRLWRRRQAHIFHDGARLYAGAAGAWPLPLIRDVVIAKSELGVSSLRLIVDDDSEVTRELVKLYLLEDRPEVVREAVLFAVAGVRGFPAGSMMN